MYGTVTGHDRVRAAERLWAGVSMTESRSQGVLRQCVDASSRWWSVPQPAKAGHDGGHADRSGARVPRCTLTGLSRAAGFVAPG